jgi:hypothetical protein
MGETGQSVPAHRSLGQEPRDRVRDELGRGHDRRVPLTRENGDAGIREGVADPLGSLPRPVRALAAEQEQRGCGDVLEPIGVQRVGLLAAGVDERLLPSPPPTSCSIRSRYSSGTTEIPGEASYRTSFPMFGVASAAPSATVAP